MISSLFQISVLTSALTMSDYICVNFQAMSHYFDGQEPSYEYTLNQFSFSEQSELYNQYHVLNKNMVGIVIASDDKPKMKIIARECAYGIKENRVVCNIFHTLT